MNSPSRGTRLNTRRHLRSAVCALAMVSAPVMAQLSATVAPEVLSPGGAARLTLSLGGDAGEVREGVAFSVDLPAGITVTSPAINSLDCPGSLSAAPGGDRIEVSGVAQAIGQDCTASVFIEADSVGNYGIESSEVSVDGAAPLPVAMTDLNVIDNQVFLALDYSSPTARWGEQLSLTYTVDGSNIGSLVSGITIQDRLPPGWSFVDDGPPESSCSDGSPGTVSASGRDFSAVSAFVFASGTCEYTLQVKAGSVGLQGHAAKLSAPNLSAQYAVAGVDVGIDALHLSHLFEGVAVPGETLDLAYTLNNTSAADATAISFSHDLDATLSGLALAGAPAAAGCGPAASVTGTSLLDFTGGRLAPGETCSIVVPVSVPAGAAAGEYASTTSVVSATLSGAAYSAPAPASATLQVAARPVLSREFLQDVTADGDTVVLEYTLRNTSDDSTLTDFGFTDDYTAFLDSFTALPSSGACGAGSSFVPETSALSSSLIARSLSVPPGDSCTFQVELRISAYPGDIQLAPITAQGSVDGGVRRAHVSGDSLRVLAAPPAQLSLSASRVGAGDSSQLTVSVGDLDAVPDRDVSSPVYSDLGWELDLAGLPASVANALPASGVCGAGSQLSRLGDRLILSDASLSAGGTCDIVLDLNVAGTAGAGDYAIELLDLSAIQEGFPVTGADQAVTLGVDALSIAIATSEQPVAPGDSLTIELAFNNPSDVTDLSELSGTLDLQAEIPGITVNAVTVDSSACPTLTASNSSGANVVFGIDTLGTQVLTGCAVSVDVTLGAGIDTGDYPLRVRNASVIYGDPGGAPSPVMVAPRLLSVVVPGEPRDLTPEALSETDPDGDGVSTAQEEAVGDGNSDGFPDALQDNVASGLAVDGSSAISVAVPPGNAMVSGFSTLEVPEDAPPEVVFPFGFVGFQIAGVAPGGTQAVEIHMPYNPDINAYWKQDRDGEWADIAASVAHSETNGRTVVTLQLVEGGPFDIESPNVSTTLTDPGGPGILPEARAIPVLPPAVLLLMMLSLAGLALRASGRR